MTRKQLYQPGDKVLIIPDFSKLQHAPGATTVLPYEYQKNMTGQIVTIQKIHSPQHCDVYYIKEDNGRNYWGQACFLPLSKTIDDLDRLFIDGKIDLEAYQVILPHVEVS